MSSHIFYLWGFVELSAHPVAGPVPDEMLTLPAPIDESVEGLARAQLGTPTVAAQLLWAPGVQAHNHRWLGCCFHSGSCLLSWSNNNAMHS